MKKLLSLLLIICSIGVAYADDKSTVTSLKYVTDELNTRQDKFGANDGKAMTFTNVAGGNLPRDVKASLGTSTSDNGLPTVSAVNTGLDDKQNTIPAVNTNTVVTYTGVAGTVGQKGIYQDTGTYASQQDNLIDAGTFNAALRNGLNNEFVCAGTDDGTPNGNCWLWTIDNETENKSPNILDVDAWFNSRKVQYTKNGNRYTITGLGTAYVQPLELPYNTYTLSIGNLTLTDGAVRPRITAGILQNGTFSAFGSVGYPDNTGVLKTSVTGEFNAIRIDHSNFGDGYTYDEIQLEVGSTRTPYVPYNENIYIPQNQSAQNN